MNLQHQRAKACRHLSVVALSLHLDVLDCRLCCCSGQRHRAQLLANQQPSKAAALNSALTTPRLASAQTDSSCDVTPPRPLPSPLALLAGQEHHPQATAATAANADFSGMTLSRPGTPDSSSSTGTGTHYPAEN